ncbi:MAG TPA: Rid family hydrolase, partial [bacterium]|jgi:2-iminobutanoate/2-iminopropanoate deaminase|nr:Rid family hydrolase [bacterium]
MTDLEDFKYVNQVYERYFPGVPPARSTVQVSKLPREAKVEIEAIAVIS